MRLSGGEKAAGRRRRGVGLRRLFGGGERPAPVAREDLAGGFKRAMRRNAGAVSIITTAHGGKIGGLTVISMTSLSLEPPTLLFTLNAGASAHDLLMASGRFAGNVLGGGQKGVAEVFSAPKRRDRRFREVAWSRTAGGPPMLEGPGAAWFDCEVEHVLERHSHKIVIGRVIGAKAGASPPLIYESGAYGRFAPLEP